MNTDLMFSSKTDMWSTPQDLFDELNAEFHFDIDACATHENAKCDWYITKEDDALSEEAFWLWGGNVFMNPPYGHGIGKWVARAYQASQQRGATVVCLLPSRTDTRWWHDYCMKGEIRFIKGRLKFGGHVNSAPFPSAVVIFRDKKQEVIQ